MIKLHQKILKRDNYLCRACGEDKALLREGDYQVHTIIPSNRLFFAGQVKSNLITLCAYHKFGADECLETRGIDCTTCEENPSALLELINSSIKQVLIDCNQHELLKG